MRMPMPDTCDCGEEFDRDRSVGCSKCKFHYCDDCMKDKLCKECAKPPNPIIEVPASWLESLANKASKARDDIDTWPMGEKKSIPVSVIILAGYANSARTLLRLKKPKTK